MNSALITGIILETGEIHASESPKTKLLLKFNQTNVQTSLQHVILIREIRNLCT